MHGYGRVMGMRCEKADVMMEVKSLANQAYIHPWRHDTQVMNRWITFLGQLTSSLKLSIDQSSLCSPNIREGLKVPFTCMFMYRSLTRKDGQNMATTAMLRSPRAAATTVVIARPQATSRGESLPWTSVPKCMNRVVSLQHNQNIHEPLH